MVKKLRVLAITVPEQLQNAEAPPWEIGLNEVSEMLKKTSLAYLVKKICKL